VELLFVVVEVCCASKVPPKQRANRIDLTAREIVIERKKVLDMKSIVNTMPELQHVNSKGL
jgi:hypothetical protein